MMRYSLLAVCVMLSLMASRAAALFEGAADASFELPAGVTITDLSVRGHIDDRNVTFTLAFTAKTTLANRTIDLLAGDLVVQEVAQPTAGYTLHYDAEKRTYSMTFAGKGTRDVAVRFAVRPTQTADGDWREASFRVPDSRVRILELTCDRVDREVRFPGAMRVEREVADETLTLTAVQGADRPYAVRWKPQVREMDAELVVASSANTIATVSVGALRVDSLFTFDISQGKLTELAFVVPEELSITQVRGAFVRDWAVSAGDEGDDGPRVLTVVLNRPVTQPYGLQVIAERTLGGFPSQLALPVLEPRGMIRADGQVAVGTDSAIELVVEQSAGLSQIDQSGFARIVMSRDALRPLPTAKAFYYSHASTPYQLLLRLDDIVPSYDVAHRTVVQLRDDDLLIEDTLELDVRNAPIRDLTLDVPGEFMVVDVRGSHVSDYRVVRGETGRVMIKFAQPVIGRTLVQVRLELGKSPLDTEQPLRGVRVTGAGNERGYVVIAAGEGVRIDVTEATELREVNAASVEMRVAAAQYAYRYRTGDWSLVLAAVKRDAGVRVEAFHLASLGEGVVYGTVAVSYYITGSPVDELQFVIPSGLANVEFVGRDVRRWEQDETDPTRWTVKLQGKVVGDYNLGVTYTQSYGDDGRVVLGQVACAGVDTQTGFVLAASHRQLEVESVGQPAGGMFAIDRDEIPANYRLLVNAPVLATFKYVSAPHAVALTVRAFDRAPLLPAVVEFTQLQTDISIEKNGKAESVTRARYMVKNMAGQFLTLRIPPDATVWSTRVVERGADGSETRTPIATARGATADELLIKLDRKHNPNEPVAIEVEFGRVHDAVRGGGAIELAAPASAVRSTFDLWRVRVPDQWAIRMTRGALDVNAAGSRLSGLADVMPLVGRAWRGAFERGFDDAARMIGAVIAVAVLAITLIVRREAIGVAVLVVVLAGATWLGVDAARSDVLAERLDVRDDMTWVELTQAVTLDEATPARVMIDVVPAWRQHATVLGAVVLPAVAVVAVALSLIFRRWRGPAAALAIAAIIYAGSQFAPTRPLVGALLTWAVPAILLGVLAGRMALTLAQRGRVMHTAAAAAATMIALMLLVGCDATPKIDKSLVEGAVLERFEAEIKAGRDSLEVTLSLSIAAAQPMSIDLLPTSAVLLSPEPADKALRLVDEHGVFRLRVLEPGRRTVSLTFLAPLDDADADQVRRFHLPQPLALTNRVTLSIPQTGLDVVAPRAVTLDVREAAGTTVVSTVHGPGDAMAFAWRPRARQASLEPTSFFAQTTSVVRFDAGLIAARHRVDYQIAQGEISELRLDVPAGMTVTAVEGADVGAWRFDPAAQVLEARLMRPVTGQYTLNVLTQTASDAMPFEATLGTLEAQGAVRQRGTLGLLVGPAVYIDIDDAPTAMNVDDFARAAEAVLAAVSTNASDVLRAAYRVDGGADRVQVRVSAVQSELQAVEAGTFTIADERLVYNGELAVTIAKAGVFHIDLTAPAAYDIDALAGDAVSHWDESVEGEWRTIKVHLRQRTVGTVALRVAMSRPIADLPQQVIAPRIAVTGALKHTGRLIVSADRSVRLAVAERDGLSELDPNDLQIRQAGVLAFRLVRPDWRLVLQTQVIQPRIVADFLHVAHVSEGLVRHDHHLRYRLFNAGAKMFEVQVPADAIGLSITGPDIARWERVDGDSGRYRIELTRKVYEQPYPLVLRYETRFDRASGEVALPAPRALDVELQRGYVAVVPSERVALEPGVVGEALQADDARRIPRHFNAGDLAQAAFCYRAATGDYTLSMRAARHDAADLLGVDVLDTHITTVATRSGDTISRVRMELSVADKRHLEARLPDGAAMWSLSINGRATPPSLRTDAQGRRVFLLPLAQSVTGEMRVQVEFVYVVPATGGFDMRRPRLEGPLFDVPLKDVRWVLFMPEGMHYDDFEGTLSVNDELLKSPVYSSYDVSAYQRDNDRSLLAMNRMAETLQNEGNRDAVAGNQYAARQKLQSAYHYSMNDAALNEDARVQLHQLIREQAVVGLVASRGRLRRQADPAAADTVDGTASMSRADLQRVRNALLKPDSENLDMIASRMIELQETAAGAAVQLMINLPQRGRVLEFTRRVQVEPDAAMVVSMRATPIAPPQRTASWMWAGGVFIGLALVFAAAPMVLRSTPGNASAA